MDDRIPRVNFPRLIPHGFGNIGKKPTRAVFTVVPGANFEKFFSELCALPAEEPPDSAKVTEIFDRYDIRGIQLVHYNGAYSNAHREVAHRREIFLAAPLEDDPSDPPRTGQSLALTCHP